MSFEDLATAKQKLSHRMYFIQNSSMICIFQRKTFSMRLLSMAFKTGE